MGKGGSAGRAQTATATATAHPDTPRHTQEWYVRVLEKGSVLATVPVCQAGQGCRVHVIRIGSLQAARRRAEGVVSEAPGQESTTRGH